MRDEYQLALDDLNRFSAEMASVWAQLFFQEARQIDFAERMEKSRLRDIAIGAAGGILSGGLGILGAGAGAGLGALLSGETFGGALSAAGAAVSRASEPRPIILGSQSPQQTIPTTPPFVPGEPILPTRVRRPEAINAEG